MADQTFTSGQVLTAAQLTALQSNIGLTYIDTVTWSSGAATQSFDSKFTSAFQNYRVILNITNSANDVSFSSKLRASTTPTATNYKTWTVYGNPPSTLAAIGSNAATEFNFGSVSSVDTMCSFDIYRPQIAKITVINGMTDNIQAAFSNAINWFDFKGHLNDTTAYDGMQFTVGSGTFTGTAVIYGYRKA